MDERYIRIFGASIAILFLIFGVVFAYFLFSISTTLYSKIVSSFLFLLSLLTLFFSGIGALYFVLSYFYEKNFEKVGKIKNQAQKFFPSVAIVMPTFNEDPKMVEKNLLKLKKMDYPNFKIYLVDDSNKEEIVKELKSFCKKEGIILIRRKERKGFKAGALNNALKYIKEEFVAIFDADEELINKKFLKETIAYFKDPKVAYVQTQKRYKKRNLFEASADSSHGFFSFFVQPGYAIKGNPIFAGSCGIFRKKVVEEIGGFPEIVVEDAGFSIKAELKGYEGIYIPKLYAIGEPLENFSTFVKQQWRYSYGNHQLFSEYVKNFFKFNLKRHVDYTSLIFGLDFLSFGVLSFSIISMLTAFLIYPKPTFDISALPEFIRKFVENFTISQQLIIFNISSILLTILASLILSKIYFGSFKLGFMNYFVNYALVFARVKGGIASILKANPALKWNKEALKNSLIQKIKFCWVELLTAFLFFFVGYILINSGNIAGSVWIFWYGILFASTFYFVWRYN
jgi:cellulose synthase/poly-beta-1,6-N-acetylglucosamine synthase-like glycosyltransferase